MSTSKGPPPLSDATPSSSNSSSGSKANLIRQDLDLMKETSAKINKYVTYLNMQIDWACEELERLQTSVSSEMDLDELKKFVKKLKSKIASPPEILCGDFNPHQNPWPNVNKASDEMMNNLFAEQDDPITDFESLLERFHGLPVERQMYLICFLWFPLRAIVQKRVMIYLWMAHPYGIQNIGEDDANKIFDEFIAQGFILPVKQNSRLVPDSCMMSQWLRYSLSNEQYKHNSCNLINFSNEFSAVGFRHTEFYECLVNVNAAIIDGWPKQSEKIRDLKLLFLGRWHTSTIHHIELPDTKIFKELKIGNQLTFLSLRGISLITELPSFISKCTSLKILDLRACHNLEVIPNWIGSLKKLTHLDVSECYLLEYIPKSLVNLSNLEVLKGFFESASKYNKGECILADLSKLPKLQKLNMNTHMEYFPGTSLMHVQFQGLQKLTISWGEGYETEYDTKFPKRREKAARLFKCFRPEEYEENLIGKAVRIRQIGMRAQYIYERSTPFSWLRKLDLQGSPGTSLPDWVNSSSLPELKSLYIKGGGQLYDIRSGNGKEQWMQVKVLHLKYLSYLVMDWGELMFQFPKLSYLHIVECPGLTDFPCDENGVWMANEAIDTCQNLAHDVQL